MDKYYFYQSYYEALKGLKPSTRYAIREAIDLYMFEDVEPTFNDTLSKSIWSLLLPILHKSKVNYANAKAKSETASESQAKPKANFKRTSSESGSELKANVEICPCKEKEKEKEKEKRESKEKTPAGVRSASASPVVRFSKPTLEQIREYITEKGYHFDAESFYAFYESKGWKVGNQSMKSWQAACVTWEKRMPHTEAEPQEEEYHQIVPLDKCRVCHSKNVATKGIYATCFACGQSFTWNRNDWREE